MLDTIIQTNVFTANLSEPELKFLEGRITGTEIIEGCPNQCIHCGTDAPQYDPDKQMKWEDLTAIVEGLYELREQGRDLVQNKVLVAVKGNATDYRVIDANDIMRTVYDVAHLFSDHQDPIWLVLGSAGWDPQDAIIQDGVQRIVNEKLFCQFNYSVKPFTQQILKEYDIFIGNVLKELIREHRICLPISYLRKFTKNRIQDFLHNSSYVANVINNLKTIQPLLYGYLTIEAMDDSDNPAYYANLPARFIHYDYLFSNDFREKLGEYLEEKAGWYVCYSKGTVGPWGRGKNLGLKEHKWSVELREKEKNGRDPSREDELIERRQDINHDGDYYAAIDIRSNLRISFGWGPHALDRVIPTKEYFLGRAEYWGNRKDFGKADYYAMLANLQGRNLSN